MTGAPDRLMNSQEFLRFERRWKIVFLLFGLTFVIAGLDWFIRTPRGGEAVLCCVVAAIGFAGGMFAARRLGDADRIEALQEGLGALDDD